MTKRKKLQNPQTTIKKTQKHIREKTTSHAVREKRSAFIRTYLKIYTIFAATLFMILAFFAHIFPYFPLDLIITTAIQKIHMSWFSTLMQVISYFGFSPQSLYTVGIISLILFIIGLRLESIIGIINALSITLIGSLIKTLISRPRPSISLVHVMQHLTEQSFPSGHVLLYSSYFGFLLYLVLTLFKASLIKKCLIIVLTLLIILIGPSRVYLGEHWASDVTGAYLLGSIWLILIINMYHWAKKRYFIHQPLAPKHI